MFAKYYCLLRIFLAISISGVFAQNSTNITEPKRNQIKLHTLQCEYAPGLYQGNRSAEMKCCAKIVQKYEFYWSISSLHLTSYLATLKDWRCPQFQEECQRKLFAINPFTRLVYKYFCEYESFVDECITSVNKTLISAILRGNGPKRILTNPTISKEQYNSISYNTSLSLDINITNLTQNLIDWHSIQNQIRITRFTLDELLKPCMQVAQYQIDEKQQGNYREIISVFIPFCETSWCGFSGDSISDYIISRWTCLTSRCHINLIIIMVFCSCLAIAITSVNAIVIAVFASNMKLLHSQSIYRVSLAIADLLIGAVVFPICINNMAFRTMTRFEYIPVMDFNSSKSISPSAKIRSGYDANESFEYYINFAGFVTFVSIFVSIYTLAVAGFDRLIAVHRPLQYRKKKAKRVALRASIASWCVAVLFAILPFFVPSLNYGLTLSFFVTMVGKFALVIIVIALAIPLIVVWIINLATYCVSRKHSKFLLQSPETSEVKTRKNEIRFARTLALMVGTFSFSTVPIFIIGLSALFVPDILPQLPRALNLDAAKTFINIELVVAILLLCNSFWNFFIYNTRNVEFRNATKVMLKTAVKKTKFSSCCNCFRTSSVTAPFQDATINNNAVTEMTKFSENNETAI